MILAVTDNALGSVEVIERLLRGEQRQLAWIGLEVVDVVDVGRRPPAGHDVPRGGRRAVPWATGELLAGLELAGADAVVARRCSGQGAVSRNACPICSCGSWPGRRPSAPGRRARSRAARIECTPRPRPSGCWGGRPGRRPTPCSTAPARCWSMGWLSPRQDALRNQARLVAAARRNLRRPGPRPPPSTRSPSGPGSGPARRTATSGTGTELAAEVLASATEQLVG